MSDTPILIVEDEWMVAAMLVTMLRAAGHTVLEPVKTIDEAFIAIIQHRPGFVLLDVTLGRVKSFPVADDLNRRGVPFLFVTGHSAEDLPLPYRFYPLLQKPISHGRLLATVQDNILQKS